MMSDKLAEKMIELLDVREHHFVLFPNGACDELLGAMARTVEDHPPDCQVTCCESRPDMASKLYNRCGKVVVEWDNPTLHLDTAPDRVALDPGYPLGVVRAFECMADGGRLVASMGGFEWIHCDWNKDTRDLKRLVGRYGGGQMVMAQQPDGWFSCMIVLNKEDR